MLVATTKHKKNNQLNSIIFSEIDHIYCSKVIDLLSSCDYFGAYITIVNSRPRYSFYPKVSLILVFSVKSFRQTQMAVVNRTQ